VTWGQLVWEIGTDPGVVVSGLGWALCFHGLWALAWVLANWRAR
jgi:hypothetical protein